MITTVCSIVETEGEKRENRKEKREKGVSGHWFPCYRPQAGRKSREYSVKIFKSVVSKLCGILHGFLTTAS